VRSKEGDEVGGRSKKHFPSCRILCVSLWKVENIGKWGEVKKVHVKTRKKPTDKRSIPWDGR
jgi:hypothetical protein